jgi:nucleoside-diphosphate-sugar epimerase
VGLALAERLLADGGHVVLFDRAAPPKFLLSRLDGARLRCVQGDIRSAADVDAALAIEGVDCVAHAAAITPDAQREAREPLDVVGVNIAGTVNLVQRCAALTKAARPLRRILVLSSVAVYGTTPPAGERYEEASSHPAPVALYGISKLAAEQAALRLAELLGLDLRVARLGPVYGPWEYATGVRDALSPHAQVLEAARSGQAAVLSRGMRADWIYSRDAAAALAALVQAPSLRHATYNVGGAAMTDLFGYCDLLAATYPRWQWRRAGPGVDATVRYGLPVDRAGLDITRLQADTGWSPHYPLAAAVADQQAWLAQHAGQVPNAQGH